VPRNTSRRDASFAPRRFGAGRLLAFVWAVTLSVLAGGAVWLEVTHVPDSPPPADRASPALAETGPPPVDDPSAPADRADPQGQVADADRDSDSAPPEAATASVTGAASDTPAAPAATDSDEAPASVRDPGAGAETGASISLAPAPDPDLVEQGENGALPVIGPDGRRPWRVYSRPYLADPDAPRIAVVIQDIGLSARDTDATLESLPPETTLAISPYAPEPGATARRARRAGHEVLVMIPMEPVSYPENDPGPHTLLVQQPAEERLARLRHVLSRFQGYVGGVNHMGSRLTARADAIRPALTEMNARGLLFLDARTSPGTVAARVAGEIGLPRAISDLYIDAEISVDAIRRNLEELERTARSGGVAIGIARPYPVSLREISQWAADLSQRGLQLAPVSATVDLQPPP